MATRKNTRSRTAYTRHFSDAELEIVRAALADSTAGLDAAIDATYVLLDRIITRIAAAPTGSADTDDGAFLKLVNAHNQTTGRIATLVRSRQIVSGTAADTLAANIAAALDQIGESLHVEL